MFLSGFRGRFGMVPPNGGQNGRDLSERAAGHARMSENTRFSRSLLSTFYGIEHFRGRAHRSPRTN